MYLNGVLAFSELEVACSPDDSEDDRNVGDTEHEKIDQSGWRKVKYSSVSIIQESEELQLSQKR